MNAMKTWTDEDYVNYVKFHLWMLGGYSGEINFRYMDNLENSDWFLPIF
jgi:hypothetical protein